MPPVEAGRLRERVTIQEDRGTATDVHGNTVEDWRPLGMVWAEVRPLTAREYLQAQQAQADVQYRVALRQSSLTDRLTGRCRLLWRGRTLYLEPPLIDRVAGEVTALAKERV